MNETTGGSGVPNPMPQHPAPKPMISHDRPAGMGSGGGLGTRSAGSGSDRDLPPEPQKSKIQLFEQRLGGKKHEEKWSRTPNSTGTGAIHVRSFHCKLVGESLEFLDQQINEWLDAHPQYEVKFVTTSIGDWTGKLREPNLIVQVWV